MKEEKQLFYAASNQIVLNPLNTWENGDMDGMVASIRSFGILEPLTVMGPFEDGNYMLLAGERRLKSIWRIEQEDGVKIPTPCYLKGDSGLSKELQKIYIDSANPESREPDIWTKNEHRESIMENLLIMQSNGEFTESKIATKASELFKCTPTYARFWKLVFQNGTESLKELLKENEISAKNAAKISCLDPEQQEEAIERIREVNSLTNRSGDLQQGVKAKDVPTVKDIIESVKGTEERKTEDEVNGIQQLEEAVAEGKPAVEEKAEKKTAKKPTLSEKDLEMLDIDAADIDIDSMLREEGYDYHDDYYGYTASVFPQKRKDVIDEDASDSMAATVIEWCREIVKKENLTDVELDAVEACKEVAEAFG